jgi:hypothetical protein
VVKARPVIAMEVHFDCLVPILALCLKKNQSSLADRNLQSMPLILMLPGLQLVLF